MSHWNHRGIAVSLLSAFKPSGLQEAWGCMVHLAICTHATVHDAEYADSVLRSMLYDPRFAMHDAQVSHQLHCMLTMMPIHDANA